MKTLSAGIYNPAKNFLDYRVRMKHEQLRNLNWQHVESIVDNSNLDGTLFGRVLENLQLCGYSEWIANYELSVVTLSWDWLKSDNKIQCFTENYPRSNLKIIDSKGYDLPESQCEKLLFELISDLPWQEFVEHK